MSKTYTTTPGVRYPSGALPDAEGVNFSIFSRHATRVELLLYHADDSPQPFQVIELDEEVNRSFYSWHVYVEGLPVGTWYAWRMDGPCDIRRTGVCFDGEKHLLDPWARAVCQKIWDRSAAMRPGDNGESSMRSVVVAGDYDWEEDELLRMPFENAIIYEVHVGGFTRHDSAGVSHRGSFAGLMEKIPYLQSLGITHVELMPVMAFDEQDVPYSTAELGLRNYWGYSTHSFFSPHPGYCVSPEQGTHLTEFRDLVKALHRAGIGVIMDVVFNHTSEGGAGGPIINFKGIGSSVFYHLDHNDMSVFRDYTGCGNTVNANHPVVATFIISCLEYWVREMHVDGFRFDLASALARGENGEPMHDSPVLWGIELSETLAGSKLIAEAWDAAGLYQVGGFPGYRWAEWNGRYRDVVRRFVRGDKGITAELATRIAGSSDFYQPQGGMPINSINFVTCHDGFTLNDLFSYNEKRNDANGESNRDGHNDNLSWNCGVEGETQDQSILALRKQLAKNTIAVLLLSQGVPMLLAGDEVLNTQQGNNNGYCQDNELTWFDWRLTDTNADMLRFVRNMSALRRRHTTLMRRRFLTGNPVNGRQLADITWHGPELGKPQWADANAQQLGFTLAAVDDDEADLHVMLNMSAKTVEMAVPLVDGRQWYRAVDTGLTSPEDISLPNEQISVEAGEYALKPRSVVVLEGVQGNRG